MKQYVTFGQDHTHTIHGVVFDKDCVATFETDADNAGRSAATVGRDRAFELFGSKFCLHYTEQNWHGHLSYFPRGFVAVPDKPAPAQAMSPVDVLAVMEASAKRLRLGVEGPVNADLLDKARDAVADLIENLRGALNTLEVAETSCGPMTTAAQVGAMAGSRAMRLRAALARVGGAA